MKTKTTLSTELFLCHEVEIHYKRPLYNEMISIFKSTDANVLIRNAIPDNHIDFKEYFYVFFLTANSRVLGLEQLSIGSIMATVVNVREIFQTALLLNAVGVILIHNHPSGNLTPSESDKIITQRVKEACVLFDMTLIDHLIITSESYYSFADDGRL
jgi:DNA repair protein RadC